MTWFLRIFLAIVYVFAFTFCSESADLKREAAFREDFSTKKLNRISDIMSKGIASEEEMRAMQKRIIELQEQMWELKR
jgi:hypothetical protein